VEDFVYPADFIVLETHKNVDINSEVSLILGRPFLATLNANINCRDGKMMITCNGKEVLINIFDHSKSEEESYINECSYEWNEVFNDNKDDQLRCPIEFESESEEEDDSKEGSDNGSSLNLELKPLPENLKYIFLNGDRNLPVIIGSDLSEEEELKLKKVLEDYKCAIGWKLADIKGISSSIVQHRINLENEFHAVREPQR
jgi:hypothetical protein